MLEKDLYVPVIWASDIAVRQDGDRLLVTGKLPLFDSHLERTRDPFLRYIRSVKSRFAQKQTGRNSPHIQFANAHDEASLTAFVRQFGPVVPSEASISPFPDPEQTAEDYQAGVDRRRTIAAVQSLRLLRNEQRIYAAALRLMIELKSGRNKPDATAILQHVIEIEEGVQNWPDQYEVERDWRKAHYLPPATWQFAAESPNEFESWKHDVEARIEYEKSSPPNRESYPNYESYLKAYARHVMIPAFRTSARDAGQYVLCKLINAFRTEVQHYQGNPAEVLDLFSLRFGIRPALYVILKKEYLGRGGAMVCGNDRCGDFFESERAGQRYCSPECSQQHRQRDYWNRTGRSTRKRRRAKLRSKRKIKPPATGSRTAQVAIIDDGGGSPQQVKLNGTGTPVSLAHIDRGQELQVKGRLPRQFLR